MRAEALWLAAADFLCFWGTREANATLSVQTLWLPATNSMLRASQLNKAIRLLTGRRAPRNGRRTPGNGRRTARKGRRTPGDKRRTPHPPPHQTNKQRKTMKQTSTVSVTMKQINTVSCTLYQTNKQTCVLYRNRPPSSRPSCQVKQTNKKGNSRPGSRFKTCILSLS